MTKQEMDKSLPFLLFLDVDGVLNNQRTFNHTPNGFTGIDDGNLRTFDKAMSIIEEKTRTVVKIILSSSWKINWKNRGKPNKDGRYLIRALKMTNHKITGFTQDDVEKSIYHPGYTRGAGIRRYLESCPHTDYLILDDEPFEFEKEELIDHFLQTDWRTGLVDEDIKNILAILDKKPQTKKLKRKHIGISDLR